jgi:hypothetical protein
MSGHYLIYFVETNTDDPELTWTEHDGYSFVYIAFARRVVRYEELHTFREQGSFACCVLHAGFLLGLLFNPEDGGDMFLPDVGWLSTDYTALYPRRQLFITLYIADNSDMSP